MYRAALIFVLLLFMALLLGTRFYPQVNRIEVIGNQHYDKATVLARSGVQLGSPLLWVTRWQFSALARDPWIARIRVIRHFPDTLSIHVWEREPFVVAGDTVYAFDGTILPDVADTEALIQLQGWGEARTQEALDILRLLADYEPKMLNYSPSGFDIDFDDQTLFTPDLHAIKTHWAGFVSQQGRAVAVYPWGVSVQP